VSVEQEKTMKTMTIDHAGAPVTALDAQTSSKAKLWTGRIMTGLPLTFLAFDGVMKLVAIPEVVEGSAKVGFQQSTLPFIGTIELLAVVLTCIHRTRVFGAVLLSAYLGGAVATHVRMGDPLFSHTLFPVYFAALVWGGLYLLDGRVRALSPFGS
jgi:hypothetical protein